MEEFLLDAEEFAQGARSTKRLPVVIQNAFKAVEFGLKAYAVRKLGRRITSHSEAKSVAYEVSEKLGDAFVEFMDLYHGSYNREDGERAKRAIKLMEEIIDEIKRNLAR
jgi:HEPN domain-containing protein